MLGQSQIKLGAVIKWGDKCHGNWQTGAPIAVLKVSDENVGYL